MNIAIVLSGGVGARLGAEEPKQYLKVAGKPILSYCIECLSNHSQIQAIQIVAALEWQEQIREWLKEADKKKKFRGFSVPGKNRQLSVLHGLEDCREYAEEGSLVLICDAARPMLTAKMIDECINAIHGHDGVLPVLPMKDTVYCSVDGKQISALLDRGQIYAGQAPELFRFKQYYKANQCLRKEEILKINGSTEPAVLAGMDIVMIPGDEKNFKITTLEDLEKFREIAEAAVRGEK